MGIVIDISHQAYHVGSMAEYVHYCRQTAHKSSGTNRTMVWVNRPYGEKIRPWLQKSIVLAKDGDVNLGLLHSLMDYAEKNRDQVI